MDGVLIPDAATSPALAEPPWRTSGRSDQRLACLEQTVRELCAEVAYLRHENAELRRENAELKQQVGYWKAMHARSLKRETKRAEELEAARGEIRKLQDRLFGRKSERTSRRDRSNQLDDPQEEDATKPPRRRGQQPGRPGPGRRDYTHLPATEQFLSLPPDQQRCPSCGLPRRPRSDTEDSEQVEIEVRAYRRVLRRRRYEPGCDCPDQPQTLTAPAPPKLIPKSRFGTSVWVHLLLEKFYLHRPLERTAAALALHGLDLSAGTITGGLKRIEPMLQAVYQALVQRQTASDFSQADETRWPVFVQREGKQGYRWWLWAFLSGEVVVFRLDASRSHEVPEGHFPREATLVLMVGRKNYYGSGSQWSGRLAVMLFSIFATLDLWKLNPRQWLTWFLKACAAAGGQSPSDISEFLLWNLSPEQRTALSSPTARPADPAESLGRPDSSPALFPEGISPRSPPGVQH